MADPYDVRLLSEVQNRAINMLVLGHRASYIVETLGLNTNQINLWKKNADFRAAINSLLLEQREATLNKLRTSSELALETLIDCMKDKDAPWVDRTRAANTILDRLKLDAAGISTATAEEIAEEDAQRERRKSLFKGA